VRGQAQVVVGADHDQAMVTDRDLGALAVGEGDEIGVQAGRLDFLCIGKGPALVEYIHQNALLDCASLELRHTM
jgi:hypothetical protein